MPISNAIFTHGLSAAGIHTRTDVDARNTALGTRPTNVRLTGADILYSLRALLATGDSFEIDLLTGAVTPSASDLATADITNTGDDNDLVATAVTAGTFGNSIRLVATGSATHFGPPAITVTGTLIEITYGTIERLLITGITDPTDSDPLVLNYRANEEGRPAWGPGGGDNNVFFSEDTWNIFVSGDSSDFIATKESTAATPVGLTSWFPVAGDGEPAVAALAASAQSLIDAITAHPQASSLLTLANAAANDGSGPLANFDETLALGDGPALFDAGVDFEGKSLPLATSVRAIQIRVPTGAVTVTDGQATPAFDLGTLPAGSIATFGNPAANLAATLADTLEVEATAAATEVILTIAAKR
jgi:hypothetical protein